MTTLLENITLELSNSKHNYRESLNSVRRLKSRLETFKELGIDKNTTDFQQSLRSMWYYRNNAKIARETALNKARKISMFHTLGGANVLDVPASLEKTQKIALTVENDFSESEYILDSGEVTSEHSWSVERTYNSRVENNFIGTYPITIERYDDYINFLNVLIDDIIVQELKTDFSISFEEWKNGHIKDGKREMKINKYLNKKGFSKYTLDFYSQQIKTEKHLYLTVSDRVQHITGMSYYATMDWTGMNGSSCQNPENEYSECVDLYPSLYDNKLVIAFLHERLEDIEEMRECGEDEGKMLARTMCRIVTVDGQQFLIGTHLYGSMNTCDELEKAMRQLNGHNIFSNKQMKAGSRLFNHNEYTNGQFTLSTSEEVHINREYDDYVQCDCPACGGSGDLEVETESGNCAEVSCPACGGGGTIETYVTAYIDEWVTVEDDIELTPYDECYSHRGNKISITLSAEVLGIETIED